MEGEGEVVAPLRALWSNRKIPCRFRAMFYGWQTRGWSRSTMSQACQYGMHLKLKKSKCFECSSLSVTKCLSLSWATELPGWLCSKFVLDIHHCHPSQGDNIFLHGLRSVAHITHLYMGWGGAGRVGVVSEGRWGEACLSGSIWIFHCFQHFLLLVGRIEMSVNEGNVKCVPVSSPQHALHRHQPTSTSVQFYWLYTIY